MVSITFIDSIRHQLQAMNATERQQTINSLCDLIYDDTATHTACPATGDNRGLPALRLVEYSYAKAITLC